MVKGILRHPVRQNVLFLLCAVKGRAQHSRGRGEGVLKKNKIIKTQEKKRSWEMTGGLFLRSELNEHRV